ncbi:MAG: hypothetical protein HW414_313 [Dehalococcoidia bacterium]|nr:hypothetical protein [Dehalococcoidia bacterium]
MVWLEGSISSAIAVFIVLGAPVFLLYAIGLRVYEGGHRKWFSGGPRREATGRGGPKRAVPQRRCWEVKHCPLDARDSCPAARYLDLPCWQAVKATLGGRVKDECPQCRMFLSC